MKQACRLLQVSRSGYYQYRQRGERDLDMATTVHLKAAFWESGRLRQSSSNHCPESSEGMPAELVVSALRMEIWQSKPAPGLLLHSDRGSQYASLEYQSLLDQHGIGCSMSRTGNCWDNAMMEHFFLNLKMERVWQRDYANHGEARRDITNYIASFYNGDQLTLEIGLSVTLRL